MFRFTDFDNLAETDLVMISDSTPWHKHVIFEEVLVDKPGNFHTLYLHSATLGSQPAVFLLNLETCKS